VRDNLPWPLDDCPGIYVETPSLGSVSYVSHDKAEDVPTLWVPDPERPSLYVERPVLPRRRPIGFGR
jgi:hypothetical protein